MFVDDFWKYDVIFEFFNGKNVVDFIDFDIFEKFDVFECEEEVFEV